MVDLSTAFCMFTRGLSGSAASRESIESQGWNHLGHLGSESRWRCQAGVSTYPAWETYKKLWKDPPFSMGKSAINGHFQ